MFRDAAKALKASLSTLPEGFVNSDRITLDLDFQTKTNRLVPAGSTQFSPIRDTAMPIPKTFVRWLIARSYGAGQTTTPEFLNWIPRQKTNTLKQFVLILKQDLLAKSPKSMNTLKAK